MTVRTQQDGGFSDLGRSELLEGNALPNEWSKACCNRRRLIQAEVFEVDVGNEVGGSFHSACVLDPVSRGWNGMSKTKPVVWLWGRWSRD